MGSKDGIWYCDVCDAAIPSGQKRYPLDAGRICCPECWAEIQGSPRQAPTPSAHQPDLACGFCGRTLAGGEAYQIVQPGNRISCNGCLALRMAGAGPSVPPVVLQPAPAPASRPPFPMLLCFGVVLYVVSFLVPLYVALLASLPQSEALQVDEPVTGVAALEMACPMLAVLALNVLGVVMACLGRGWGAILMLCTWLAGGLLAVIAYGALSMQHLPSCIEFTSLALGVGSLVCFLLPQAWDYYRKCEEYRQARRSP